MRPILYSPHLVCAYLLAFFFTCPLSPSFTQPSLLFFFNDTATTEIYTLSLHDALPIYIPREELRRFNVTEQELFARAENDRIRALIEFQIDRAEGYFRAAEPLLGELSFDARFPTLLMGGVYATVLGKLRKDPLTAIRRRLSLSKLQKVMVVGSRVLRPR